MTNQRRPSSDHIDDILFGTPIDDIFERLIGIDPREIDFEDVRVQFEAKMHSHIATLELSLDEKLSELIENKVRLLVVSKLLSELNP